MRRWGLVVLFCIFAAGWNVFLFWAAPWGASRMAGVAERILGSLFQGEILVGEIRLEGLVRVGIEPVLFVDPKGAPAASVRRVEIRISPWGLLRGELLTEVGLDRPLVRIAAEDPFAGLGGVFQPETRPPPREGETEAPRAPFPLDLEALRISDGSFLLSTEEGERQVLVRGIGIFAEGEWRGEEAELLLRLDAWAHLPVESPLHLDLRASLVGWDLRLLELLVALGATELEASGVGNIRSLWGDVRLSGVVDPAHARAFGVRIPSRLPFRADVHLARESRAELRLEPRAGGRVLLDLRGHDFLRYEGSFLLQNVDPSAYWEGAPRARVGGRGSVSARLDGAPEAAVSFQLDPGPILGPGRVRARLHGETLEIEAFELDFPGGRARSDGRVGPETGLRLRLEVDDLSRLAAFATSSLGLDLPRLGGVGSVDLRLRGALPSPSFEVDGHFAHLTVDELLVTGLELRGSGRLGPLRGRATVLADRLRLRGLEFERVRLKARRDERRTIATAIRADEEGRADAIVGAFSLRPGAGRLRGEGSLAASGVGAVRIVADLPARSPRPSDRLQLDLRIDPLDPSRLGRWFDLRLPPAVVRSRLQLRGTLARPLFDGTILVSDLRPRIDRGPIVDAHLVLRLRGHDGSLRASAWQGETRILELTGSFPFSLRLALRDPERALRSLLDAPDASGSLRARGIDLAEWALGPSPGIRGNAAASLDFEGPLRRPRGELRLELAAAPLGALGRVDLALAARSTSSSVQVDLLGSVMDQPPLRLVARVDEPLAAVLALSEETDVSIFWDLASFDLSVLPLRRAMAGILTTRGRVQGRLRALSGSAMVDARDLSWGRSRLGSVGARLELDSDYDLRIFAIDPAAGTLEARVTTLGGTSTPPWKLDRSRLLRARLQADGFSLAPLALLPAVATAEGRLYADLSGEGRLDSIVPVGALEIQEGVVQVVGGLRYDRIGLRAAFEPGRVEIPLLEVHGGRGIAVLRGELEGRPSRFGFDFGLRSRDFPVGGSEGVAALVGTRGRITGRMDEELEASVELDSAQVELPTLAARNLHPLAPPPDLVFFEEREEEAPAPTLPLTVRLSVAEPVRIRGPDLSLDADVGLVLRRREGGDLRATGEAETRGGQVSLFGRTFTIESSRVQWVDAPLADPDLALRARFESVGATAWVDVGGTVGEPVVNLRSEPPLSEGEIALLIAAGGGRPAGGLTPTEGEPVDETEAGVGAAASLLGSVAADRFLQALGPAVPIDVLTVEAVDGRTLLQAGTYVGPRLYVGYARNLFPEPWENANEVRLTYRLSRTLAVQSNFGDAASGGVDLVWVEQFPTATQRERRREAALERGETGRRSCVGRAAVVACGP